VPWNEASELLVPVIGFWLSGTLGTGDGRNQRQRPVPCHDVITLGMPGRGWHGGLTKGNKILQPCLIKMLDLHYVLPTGIRRLINRLNLNRLAWSFYDSALVLLCHKTLARFDGTLSGMEILTRGGGLWVSCRAQATANHASGHMSRH